MVGKWNGDKRRRRAYLSLNHQPVLVHQAIVGEATQGVDPLLGKVSLSGGRLPVTRLPDTVDLLVDCLFVEVGEWVGEKKAV